MSRLGKIATVLAAVFLASCAGSMFLMTVYPAMGTVLVLSIFGLMSMCYVATVEDRRRAHDRPLQEREEGMKYDLVCPFLTDDPVFARGVEFGMLYAMMQTEDEIKDFITVDNQEQVTLLANRTGWIIDEMRKHDDGWIWIEMRLGTVKKPEGAG